MAYLVEKKKAKKEIIDKLQSGEATRVLTIAFCEFCKSKQKKWDVYLVCMDNKRYLDKKMQWLIGDDAEFIMSCTSCCKKYDMKPLWNDQAGEWDGVNEALKQYFEK